ncbi:ImmA/IrrE family metallo-endopeptidase [Candidatus Synechococcus spongiarum]
MPSSRMEGLVSAGGPACAITSQRRETAKRFVLARALGDYIGRSDAGLGILTSMDTARQARSRAFAAELLAPAESLRPRLADQGVNVHDLGQEFDVSTQLINHQITNHGLPQPYSSSAHG